jgi:hypothetical protein
VRSYPSHPLLEMTPIGFVKESHSLIPIKIASVVARAPSETCNQQGFVNESYPVQLDCLRRSLPSYHLQKGQNRRINA